jgi:hypothetical protein
MSPTYIAIAIGYGAFSIMLAALELRRSRGTGPDAITIFIAIFMLQCCLPGIGIYMALAVADPTDLTGNSVFDLIYHHLNVTNALVVLAMTVWFAAFFYLGASFGRLVLRRLFPTPLAVAYRLEGVEHRFVIILFGGLVLTVVSFFFLGDDMTDRFANLVRLRAYDENVVRTDFFAYAYVLTQTWAWLSIPALFVLSERRRRRGLLWFSILIGAVIFAILSASRRAIFVPVMLSYFTVLLFDGKWRVRLILAISIPILALVMFGKEFFATIAFGGAVEEVAGRYESTASAILRASSEQGITIIESLGTLTFLDEHLRLGIDHLLSIAQRFPHRLLGFEIDYPKRIVRISTEAFSSVEAQDIPPGLIGQMWLDFRVLGPVVWGLAFGLQMSMAQFIFVRSERSLQASALVALLVFLIALPINTGSYDFTFSVDVIAAVVGLALTYRVRRMTAAN